MLDRRLLGALGMVAILSSGLFNLFFTVEAERSIEILKNDWAVPGQIGGGRLPLEERRYPYTLGMMIRKPVHDLVLRFGVLRDRPFAANYTAWQGLSTREKALRVKAVNELDGKVRDRYGPLGVEVLEREVDFDWRGPKCKILLLDYSPCVEALAPPQAGEDLALLFALVFDDSGNLSQFYRGYPDFFLARRTAIQDMTIQLNDNLTKYSPPLIRQPGSFSLDDLPALGTVRYRDLEKGDRLFFSMGVTGARIGGTEAIMQVVQIRVDGQYIDPIINILTR